MDESWLEEFRQLAISGPCRMAVDIGANVGEWTAWMCNHFDAVIAIEPDPRAFDILADRAGKNAVVINAAVAAEGGAVKLFLRESPLQTSLLATHPIGAGQHDTPAIQTIDIPALAIDEIIELAGGVIDFVKMDIEGAEGVILPAAKDPRWLKTRWLIEVHDTRVAVGEFLERIGFEGLRLQRHPNQDAHPEHFWVYAAEGLDVGN